VPITPSKVTSNVGNVCNKSYTNGVAVSPLGLHVPSSSAAEGKAIKNGTGPTALIGPQLPHSRICSTAGNGNKSADDCKGLHLPHTSVTNKLVVHNGNGSSGPPTRPTNLLVKTDNIVSATSALQPSGHTITAVNNRSSTFSQSGKVH